MSGFGGHIMARAFLRGDLDLLGYEPTGERDYEVDNNSFSVIKAYAQAFDPRLENQV
jgi:hypothetical protein